MKKILVILIIAFCFYPFQVMASENNKVSKTTGDIHVTIKKPSTKKPISGLKLKFYYVATVNKASGNIIYDLTPDFKGCGIFVNEINENSKEDVAKVLKSYVHKNKISAIDIYTDKNGIATLKSCKLGLYLITLDKILGNASSGDIEPFIIAVPYTSVDGTALMYTIEASPKVEVNIDDPTDPYDPKDDIGQDKDKDDKPDTKPDGNPDDKKDPNNNLPGDKPKLPQTGVLQWPIPVMAVIGVILFSLGWVDVFLRGKKDDV